MKNIDLSLHHSQNQDANPSTYEQNNISLAVLIVTFNSQQDLKQNLSFLSRQTQLPDVVTVIDCASSSQDYLDEAESMLWPFALSIERLSTNQGYAGGNNLGLKQLAHQHLGYVLVLNPDAFLVSPDCIAKLLEAARKLPQPHLIAPLLMHFDRGFDQLSGLVDSAGLEQNVVGRWFDRLQGQPLPQHNSAPECVIGLCGAALLLPVPLIRSLLLQRQSVFDSSFFMYKEDIELSCYLNKIGVKQYLLWGVSVGHCRGWDKHRKSVSRWARMLSAKNDVRVAWRYRWLSLPFTIAKYLAVKLFDM